MARVLLDELRVEHQLAAIKHKAELTEAKATAVAKLAAMTTLYETENSKAGTSTTVVVQSSKGRRCGSPVWILPSVLVNQAR